MGRVVLGQLKDSNRPLTCPRTGLSNRCLEEKVHGKQAVKFPTAFSQPAAICPRGFPKKDKLLEAKLFLELSSFFVESPFEPVLNFGTKGELWQ